MVALILALASPAAFAQRARPPSDYKDPLGRFTLGLPPGWALERPEEGDCFTAGHTLVTKDGREEIALINISCDGGPDAEPFDVSEFLRELDTPAGLAAFMFGISEGSEFDVRYESHGRGLLGKSPAVRWVYRMDLPSSTGPMDVFGVQYLASLPDLRGQYVFNCMTSRPDVAAGIALCDAVANTFKLVHDGAPSMRI